ncbi:MAG: hypothetical protein JWO62_3591 [Acidimicrobiaceae bacterium]|jgi:hypothetical protein|nr:hypothetical protein [Acidimicrobiaceae bacterium]
MPKRARPAQALAIATAAALGATTLGAWGGRPATTGRAGNGVGSLPANEVLAKAAQAVARENAIVVVGSLRLGTEAITFSVRSTERGADVSGSLTVRAGAKVVGPVKFIAFPSVLYLEAGTAFWRQAISSAKSAPTGATAAEIVAKLSDRWIKITGTQAKSFAAGFGGLTDPGKFAQSLLSGNGTLVKSTPRVVRGHEVLPITSSQGGTIYVDLTGPPVPIAISGKAALGSSSVAANAAMSYPTKLAITAPAGAVTLAAIDQSLAG